MAAAVEDDDVFLAKLARRFERFAQVKSRHFSWFAFDPPESLVTDPTVPLGCDFAAQLGYGLDPCDDTCADFYDKLKRSSLWKSSVKGGGFPGVVEALNEKFKDEKHAMAVVKYAHAWKDHKYWYALYPKKKPWIEPNNPKDMWTKKQFQHLQKPKVHATPQKPRKSSVESYFDDDDTQETKMVWSDDRPSTAGRQQIEQWGVTATVDIPGVAAKGSDGLGKSLALFMLEKSGLKTGGSIEVKRSNSTMVSLNLVVKREGTSRWTSARKSLDASEAMKLAYDEDVDGAFVALSRRFPGSFARAAAERGLTVVTRLSTENTLALIHEANLNVSQTRVIKSFLDEACGTPMLAVESALLQAQKGRRLDDADLETGYFEFEDENGDTKTAAFVRARSLGPSLERTLNENPFVERALGPEAPSGAVPTCVSLDKGGGLGGSTKGILEAKTHKEPNSVTKLGLLAHMYGPDDYEYTEKLMGKLYDEHADFPNRRIYQFTADDCHQFKYLNQCAMRGLVELTITDGPILAELERATVRDGVSKGGLPVLVRDQDGKATGIAFLGPTMSWSKVLEQRESMVVKIRTDSGQPALLEGRVVKVELASERPKVLPQEEEVTEAQKTSRCAMVGTVIEAMKRAKREREQDATAARKRMRTAKAVHTPLKKEHAKQLRLRDDTEGQSLKAKLTRKTAKKAIAAMRDEFDAATKELEAATTAVEASTHMQSGIDDSIEYAVKLKRELGP